jgi:signal transduction histidine kinase/ActR/RegA family two-component response regulator
MQPAPDETQSLRRCIRDLVALSALSATWSRADMQGVAGSLADVLLRALQVEFVYARVRELDDGPAFEVVRVYRGNETTGLAREVGGALEPWLRSGLGSTPTTTNPVGDGTVRLAVIPIGYDANCGFVVAGSRQPDFPVQTDRLLLAVGVNQAAVVLQNKRTEAAFQELDRRKDEFLAILAHELRNPLAPLSNSLEILRLAKEYSPEFIEQTRGTMERQVRQLVRLVDDLMDVSRITRGKIELRRERTELRAVLEHAVETARPLIEGAGHELTVVIPPEPVFLDADPGRLEQVFANLLNNAAKYTRPAGQIRLAAERQGSEVIVKVRDTGIGMPPDVLPRIFDIFTQGDRSLERAQGGLGIGLSIVRGVVELHGGSVTAHSAGPGQGSELTVRLPALAPSAQEGRTAEDGGEPAAVPAPHRILLADDNQDSVESLALLLTLRGSEVRTARDGWEAVEAAAAYGPDVVLLDIGMPRLNGYEAARKIREQSRGERMVLIALTGWGQEEDRQRSTEAGFDFHLVKPVDFAALEKLLASLATSGGSRVGRG